MEAATRLGLLFHGMRRRDVELADHSKLGWHHGCEVAVLVISSSLLHQLQGLEYRAAKHDPKRKVDFQRDPHRASPHSSGPGR